MEHNNASKTAVPPKCLSCPVVCCAHGRATITRCDGSHSCHLLLTTISETSTKTSIALQPSASPVRSVLSNDTA